MRKPLAKFVKANSRFSRSANVERDRGGAAIDGYVPTGRAIDVISRLSSGLLDPSAGRTFSITGPHGGGKSSLAVFMDALLARASSSDFKTSHSILEAIDPSVELRLREGMQALKAGRTGFIRAFATARNEPVAVTIARALHAGATRQNGLKQDLVPEGFISAKRQPSAVDIRECIERMTEVRPVLLVIDEFGKNLEYFATSGTDGDPFLLQELAEMTQGADAAPLVIITMQHLSFDEYVQGSSTARRREWSKVQGRFQDIPYLETPAQARRLIASALSQDDVFRRAADQWVAQNREVLEVAGLRDVADDAPAALPLHPIALAVLPDLCSRYGQNERTLFSFLTGSEPSALPQYLAVTTWDSASSDPIPLAGLDLLYDYFLESSSSMIGVADGASRWMEIETRIRDTAGLTLGQLRALKAIGLLNLVSSGGRIRASRALLELALGPDEFEPLLASLVDSGLVTYRAFSDEYRIWQGSDYNLRRVIDNARHDYDNARLVDLLDDALKLDPLVAGRHSQRTGVLRVFARRFSAGGPADSPPLDPSWDGIVYYATESTIDLATASKPDDGRPAVYVIPDDVSAVREAATDAASLNSALRSAEVEGADWVARQELVERASAAQQRLHKVIADTWDTRADWIVAGTGEELDPRLGLSALLSDVSDKAYSDTPNVANEMISRRELTSQGAKARRFLTDALLIKHDLDAFGIEGYGPERAIYEAVFRKTGIHRITRAAGMTLGLPTEPSWKAVWALVNSAFDGATGSRLNLAEIGRQMKLPPFGLKDGIIPLLLITALVARSDEIAVYEHGSLVLAIDDAVAERLTKNPVHFSIKNTETRGTKRSMVIDCLVSELGISNGNATPTFLNVATALYRELRKLPPYSQKTRANLSDRAIAVREAFHQASEPDVLIFETLPEILGYRPFTGRGAADAVGAKQFASRLASAIRELIDAYPQLLNSIEMHLAHATSTGGSLSEIRHRLASDATRLEGNVLEPRLRAFVGALARPLEDQTWLENVAMVVCEGQAPRVWTDDIAGLFPLRIAELGGALRRTSALLHDRLAANLEQGYSCSRMTLTRPDGTETIELLALTAPEKAAIDPHFSRVIDTLTEGGLSRSAACRMLMARLVVEQDTTLPGTASRGTKGEGKRHA